MTGLDAKGWEELVTSREVELPNQVIEEGIKFLDRSHTRQGWGAFLGMAFDRRASAAAMEALEATRTKSETNSMLVPTIEAFRDKYEKQYPGLGIDAVTDVIYLLKPALASDTPDRKALLSRANEVLEEFFRDVPTDAPRRISTLHLAVQKVEPFSDARRKSICDFLLSQQSSNGSWAPTRGADPSLASTAEATRALSNFERDDATKGVQLASSFLIAESRRLLDHREGVDTFDLVVSLRALAEVKDVDYALVSALESELMRRRNQDGGWASSAGRDSSVELTGLAILALVAAGAFRHVPARLAHAMIGSLGRSLDEAAADSKSELALRERAAGAERAEDAVDAAHKKIREQANLISQLELKTKLAQRVARPINPEPQMMIEENTRVTWGLIALATVVVVIGTAGVAAGIKNSSGSIFGIAAASLSVVLALLAMAYTLRRSRIQRSLASGYLSEIALGQDDPHLSSLRRSFQEIVSDWPLPAREELPYLLFDRFLDAPSDVAARRAERVAINLGIRGPGVEQFTSWGSAVGLLTEAERRVLFEQLRRQSL